MKKILKLFLLLVCGALTLCSCEQPDEYELPEGANVSMIARIDKIDEKLEVMVKESEYTYGTHLVITSDSTQYIGKDGQKITRDDLRAAQVVEILYNGQVMLSYPPQIVALRITVIE